LRLLRKNIIYDWNNNDNKEWENNMTKKEKLDLLVLAERDILAKSKTYHIKGMDWEDMAQIMRMTIWKVANKYDEKRGSKRTFIHFVIQNKLRDLARRTKTLKRYEDYNHLSLDSLIEKEKR